MEKVLLIDNYDSFTFNLYHYLDEMWPEGIEVVRNDVLNTLNFNQFHKVIISPGPGLPEEAGQLLESLAMIKHTHHILGICLGLQAIAKTFDCKLKQLDKVVHGQSTTIYQKSDSKIFNGLPQHFKVGRYHSWVMDVNSKNEDIKVTAVDEKDDIMALEHSFLPIYGLQFHPESVLCEYGKTMLKNWLYCL
ncbi:MAG: aminodeoxychorismate/anthranilate synthase component II [Verrucomicrobia bacterium]|nr:aminodeoxychorismate/anthranilate synthase component II [Verrucomicrobiota bacterium]